ncbi:FtsQ-type POTRA domain-containing protein [Micrococcales bacterium 31B]|nr:FtsQ-type POTRA domain-containing protein [Micrococcales bacterium 31B]
MSEPTARPSSAADTESDINTTEIAQGKRSSLPSWLREEPDEGAIDTWYSAPIAIQRGRDGYTAALESDSLSDVIQVSARSEGEAGARRFPREDDSEFDTDVYRAASDDADPAPDSDSSAVMRGGEQPREEEVEASAEPDEAPRVEPLAVESVGSPGVREAGNSDEPDSAVQAAVAPPQGNPRGGTLARAFGGLFNAKTRALDSGLRDEDPGTSGSVRSAEAVGEAANPDDVTAQYAPVPADPDGSEDVTAEYAPVPDSSNQPAPAAAAEFVPRVVTSSASTRAGQAEDRPGQTGEQSQGQPDARPRAAASGGSASRGAPTTTEAGSRGGGATRPPARPHPTTVMRDAMGALSEGGARSGAYVRKLSWKVWVSLGAVLAVIAAGLVVVFATSVFAVRTITFEGQQAVTQEALASATQSLVGVPLARVSLPDAAAAAAAVPGVETATVSREWPNTLRVTIVERVPVAVYRAGDGLVLIDKTGYSLRPVSEAPAGMPLVSVEPFDGMLLAQSLAIYEQMPSAIKPQIVDFGATSRDGIYFNLTDNRQVIWGSADLTPAKIAVLPTVLGQPGMAVYEVSSPESVVTRAQ